jgi:hypothetical protein
MTSNNFTQNTFDFGPKKFNGDNADWPEFYGHCKATAYIKENPWKGLLSGEVLTERDYLGMVANNPTMSIHPDTLRFELSEDPVVQEKQLTLLSCFQTELFINLEKPVQMFLTKEFKTTGEEVYEVDVRRIFESLRNKY